MKDKTAAAKVLLDNVWTLDEVIGVLFEGKKAEPAPIPYPYYPVPVYPYWPWYVATDGVSETYYTITVNTESSKVIDDFRAMQTMAGA